MADFNYREWADARKANGGYGNYNLPIAGSQGMSWADFDNKYNQVAAANRIVNADDQTPHRKNSVQMSDGRYYRQMTGGEKAFAHINDVTNALSSYSGWDLEKGWTPENITRFIVGLPGMMLSAPTDLLARGYETLSGSKVTEADSESGYIPDEMMTGTERAANLGYIATDLLSFIPGIAPEAKLAGVGLKGIGRAAGIESKAVRELSDVAAKGLIKKSGLIEGMGKAAGWSEGKIKAAKAFDTAAEVGASTIFEGTQEGLQQGFEDLRYGNFDENTMDRMIESATWGGLGGFAMGGGAAVGDKLVSRIKPKTRAMTEESRTAESQLREKDPWEMKPENHSGFVPLSIQQSVLEDARSDDRLARGGIMSENVSGDDRLGLDDMIAGAEDFAESFTTGNDRHKIGLAKQICNIKRNQNDENVTKLAVAETQRAISAHEVVDKKGQLHSYGTLEDALNALLVKYYGKKRGFRAAWEKSPATKNRGGYLDVVSFHAGRGIIVNPLVAPMTGMDFDGDKSAVFFNTYTDDGYDLLNLIGYASDLLLSREGIAQSDIWYSGFRKGLFEKGLFKKKLKNIFRFFDVDKSVINSYAKRMQEAVNSEKDSTGKVSRLLYEIAETYDQLRSDPNLRAEKYKDKENLPGKRTIIGDLFGYASTESLGKINNMVQEFYLPRVKRAVLNEILDDPGVTKEIKEDIALVMTGTKDLSEARKTGPLYSQGNIGENTNLTSIYQDIGLLIWTLVTGENPIFRQQGQLNITMAKKQFALSDVMDGAKYGLMPDSFETLVRITFRIARATATPLSAIEGLLDMNTYRVSSSSFGLQEGKRIDSAESFEAFQEELRKAYNEDVKTYKEVKKVEYSGGYEEDFFAPKRDEIAEGSASDIDSLMIRIYGMTNMEDIFGRRFLSKEYWEVPLSAVLEQYALDPGAFSHIFTEAGDPELEKRFSRLCRAYGQEKKKAGKRILNLVESYSVSDILSRIEKNGGKIARRDYPAVIWLFNAIVEIMGPEFAISMNLTDPIHFFENTILGKMFLSEDVAVRKNALLSLLAKSRFYTIERILSNVDNYEGEKLENLRTWALRTLEEYSSQSNTPLKAIIAQQIKDSDTGSSAILDALTDLSLSFDQKVNVIERHLSPIFPDIDVISDFLVDDAGDFSISSLSKDYQKADTSVQKYTEYLYKESQAAVETLFGEADRGGAVSQEIVVNALRTAVTAARIEVSTEPYVVGIIDSLRGGHGWAEKGVSPKSFSAAGEEMLFVQNGTALSYIDQLTSGASGGISSSDLAYNRKLLCSMLANPEEQVRITFKVGGRTKCMYVSGNKIFSEVSESYDPTKGPQYADWRALLLHAPHIEAWISDCYAQPTLSGKEGSATIAKASNVYQMVQKYQETVESVTKAGDVSAREVYQVEYAINEIKNLLLNDIPFIKDILIYCIDDLGIPSNADPAAVEKAFNDKLDAFSTAFYFHAQRRGPNGEVTSVYRSKRQRHLSQVESSYSEDARVLFESLDDKIDHEWAETKEIQKLIRLQTARDNKHKCFLWALNELSSVFADEDTSKGPWPELGIEERTSQVLSSLQERSLKTRLILSQLDVISAIQSRPDISAQDDSDFDYDMPERNGAAYGVTPDEYLAIIDDARGCYAVREEDLTPEQLLAVEKLRVRYEDYIKDTDLALEAYRQEELDLKQWENETTARIDEEIKRLDKEIAEYQKLLGDPLLSEEERVSVESDLEYAKIKKRGEENAWQTILSNDFQEDNEAPILDKLNKECFQRICESEDELKEALSNLNMMLERARRFSRDAFSLKQYRVIDVERLGEDRKDGVFYLYTQNPDGTFSIDPKQRDKLINDANRLLASSLIKDLRAEWQADVNENGLALQENYIETFDRISEEVFNLLSTKKNPLNPEVPLLVDSVDQLDQIAELRYKGKKDFPKPSFTSSANTAASSMMTVGLSGSLVVGNINRNGGSLKECVGLGYISTEIQGTVPPRKLTVGQLRKIRGGREYGDEVRRWHYVKSGEWSPEEGSLGDTWEIGTVGYLLDNVQDDTEVLVLHPEDNPNGLWMTNTPAAPFEKNRSSLRYANIVGGCIDCSQEGMVLQAKKRFEARMKLVAEKTEREIDNLKIIIPNPEALVEDPSAVRKKVKQLLIKYRHGLEKEFRDAFKDSNQLKKTGYGKEQARILAQGVTPAVVLTVNNKQYAISSYKLWDDDLFSHRLIEEILAGLDSENIGAIEFSVLVVSPTEMSSRINEVTDEYNKETAKAKIRPDRKELGKRAYTAAVEWDDYVVNDSSVDNVLFSYNPLGRARKHTIPTENSLTFVQQYLGQSFDGKTPAVTTPSIASCSPITKRGTPSVYEAVSSLSKNIFREKTSRRIIKIYCSDDQAASIGTKTGLFNEVQQLRKQGDVYWGEQSAGTMVGCALVLDHNLIEDAVAWARKTRSQLAVSKQVYMQLSEDERLNWTTSLHENGYMMLDPSRGITGSAIDMSKTSPVTYLNPDSIEGCYIDGVSAHLYNMGDSDIWCSDDYNMSMVFHSAKKSSIKSLTGGTLGSREFVTREDAEKMLSLLYNEDMTPKPAKEWEKAGFYLKAPELKEMKFGIIAQRIREYLLSVKNGDIGEDGVKHTGAGAGQVVSIIKLVRADGETLYAPVFAPKNSPKAYDNCYLCEDELGNLYVGFSKIGPVTEDEGWFFKLALDNEFFKGIVSQAPAGTVFLEYGDGRKIKLVATYDTEKSRSPGREKIIFASSMWYFSKKENMSVLFDETGKVKKNIEDAYSTTVRNEETGDFVSTVDREALNALLRGEKSEWDKVAAGTIEFYPGENDVSKARNKAIQKVVKSCFGKVPIIELMSHIGQDTGINTKTDISIFMAIKDLELDEMLAFFSCFDENLCPYSSFEETTDDRYWFRADGTFRCQHNGDVFYAPVRWAPHDAAGNFSALEGPGGEARESNQGLVRLSLEQQMLNKDFKTLMDFSSYLVGNPEFYSQRRIDKIAEKGVENLKPGLTPRMKKRAEVIGRRYDTAKELEHRLSVLDVDRTYRPGYEAEIFDSAGKDRSDDWYKDPDIKAAIGKFEEATGSSWSYRTLYCFIADELGHTYSESGGRGKMEISDMVSALHTMTDNISKYGLLIVAKKTVSKDRVSMGGMNPEFARLLWEKCPTIKDHPLNIDPLTGTPSFEAFSQRMIEEQRKSDEYVHSLPPAMSAKKMALSKASEYHFMQWGLEYERRLYENIYSEDIIHSNDWLSEILREESVYGDFDIEAFKELEERGLEVMQAQKAREEGQASMERVSPSPSGATVYAYKNDSARPYVTFFRNATDLSRMQGLSDLFIPVSNIGYRAVNQTIMDATMAAGRKGKGPYKVSQGLNQDIVRQVAANDSEGYKIWIAMHEAALSRDEVNFMMSLNSEAELDAWMKEQAKKSGRFGRFKKALFKAASGGGWGMRKQLINFLNRITCFFNEDPVLKAYWLTPDPSTGLTRMDEMLSQPGGLATFFREVFYGGDRGSASYIAGSNALQSVRIADLAQDHVLMEMFKNATNRHPLPEFLMTTLVSRFPAYSLNFTEKILNFILPISALRYVFIDFVAQRGHEKAAKAEASGKTYIDPHYERFQRNTSLREALLVDMCHLGAGMLAMLVAALPGGVEPPDDEAKWGNPEEWLFFGMRIGEAWWIEDIMGIALPLAAYHKSVMLGRPRLDLLVNGVADTCYSNPMFKVSDAISMMMDPLDGFYNDYEQQVEKYKNSRGGGLSFLEYLSDNASTFGLSYVSQFFTPTFVKSAWNMIMPYEADYRHVYQENSRGILTDKGSSGSKLIEISYDDAMLRRLTRRNPILALIIDLTHPGNTAYSPLGFPGKMAMPLTVYNDQHQYAYMKAWSIEGLSEQDAQAKILQILVTLEQYQDNLDELISTGFYLDSGTKKAVSEAMWDRYYSIDEQWNKMQEEGMLDFYYLGDGDYETGRSKYYEYKDLKDKTKRYYSDLYYKTMKSEQLSRPMVTYNRYNTTYAQDDNGDWYATGFKPSGILPFTFAPGTIDSAEGTAGYENDFVTISAVDGLPLEGMRALVPTNAGEYEEWPDLKFWAADGDGNGYSEQYQKWMGAESSTPSSTSSSTSRSTRSSGGSGGGGGGGGYRSSAGGFYAPSVSLPRTNSSRIMNTDRAIKPNYDYLRPDFETKGSREAYRRSDI